MNIDFSAEPLFSAYVIGLLVSGVLLLGLSVFSFQGVFARIFSLLAGGGMLAYGVYLGWFFEGASYHLFFYVFVLPVIALINLIKAIGGRNSARAQQQQFAQPQVPHPYQMALQQQPFPPQAAPPQQVGYPQQPPYPHGYPQQSPYPQQPPPQS